MIDLSEYAGAPPAGATRISSGIDDADYGECDLCEVCGFLVDKGSRYCPRCAAVERGKARDVELDRNRQRNHRIYVPCRWMGLPQRRTNDHPLQARPAHLCRWMALPRARS